MGGTPRNTTLSLCAFKEISWVNKSKLFLVLVSAAGNMWKTAITYWSKKGGMSTIFKQNNLASLWFPSLDYHLGQGGRFLGWGWGMTRLGGLLVFHCFVVCVPGHGCMSVGSQSPTSWIFYGTVAHPQLYEDRSGFKHPRAPFSMVAVLYFLCLHTVGLGMTSLFGSEFGPTLALW